MSGYPPDELLADSVDEPARDPGWWDAIRHPSRRGWMLIVSATTTLVLLAVALWLPVPFVKLSPGPTFNVIGQDDGEDVITITGTETFPVSGTLDMTTVYERGGPRRGLTFVEAVAAWLNPSDAVVPRELLFPDDITGEEVQQRQALLFDTSESNAVAAAMRYLDRPVSTTVVANAVYPDTPADGVLLPKDEIVRVDGEDVTSAEQVVRIVRGSPVGSTFTMDIRRDGVEVDGAVQDDVEQTVTVTSVPNPEDPEVPLIGVGVGELYSADFPITFTLEDVGGPSAGLVFALGLVDKLTPEDLIAGQHVAGTGTIDPQGTVGPIGGIRQKLVGARDSGATLFVMPAEHCAEIEGHVPDGLTVVPISTLSDAVDAIGAFRDGAPVPTCPVDAA